MHTRILAAALAVYTAFVLVVTLSPRMPGTSFAAEFVNSVLGWFHERGLLIGMEYLDVEFLANVGMFVPLGVLVLLLMRRWWMLFAGTAFSAFIETYQALFLPGRYPELRDVLSNSIGFLLGAGVAYVLHRFWSNRLKSPHE
ncbi:hypothetical protein BH11ACT5_BH11ACT5_06400 [soil metagenome]